MRTYSVTSVIAAAAAAGGLLAGCGNAGTGPASAPPAASSTTGAGQQQHNQADIAFLQGMIPHHDQAIAMAQLASTRAASPKVKDLAGRIQTEQGPEIAQMSALLRSWGAPVPATTHGMTGMQPEHAGMPGMMSSSQMQQLTATTGAGFDRMFLQMMIAHHQGAVTMSQTELTQGSNPTARHLAQQIITAQQAEIEQCKPCFARANQHHQHGWTAAAPRVCCGPPVLVPAADRQHPTRSSQALDRVHRPRSRHSGRVLAAPSRNRICGDGLPRIASAQVAPSQNPSCNQLSGLVFRDRFRDDSPNVPPTSGNPRAVVGAPHPGTDLLYPYVGSSAGAFVGQEKSCSRCYWGLPPWRARSAWAP
jgi:uncharacterized protein (DUF305 family)